MKLTVVCGLQSEIPIPEQEKVIWTPALKQLKNMCIALVTAGGIYPKEDKKFNLAGDYTFRKISDRLSAADLRVCHNGYDNVDVNKDINCMFPLDILHKLRDEKFIKDCAPFHIGFMGGGADFEKFFVETAPEMVKILKKGKVDGVIVTAG